MDFSRHGLDLYYNYKFLEHLLGMKNSKSMDIFLMVFPHYYLNYDMSKSIYQFSFGQIFACRGFRDWHNAKASLNKNINEYLISKEMFGKNWEYMNPQ